MSVSMAIFYIVARITSPCTTKTCSDTYTTARVDFVTISN